MYLKQIQFRIINHHRRLEFKGVQFIKKGPVCIVLWIDRVNRFEPRNPLSATLALLASCQLHNAQQITKTFKRVGVATCDTGIVRIEYQ